MLITCLMLSVLLIVMVLGMLGSRGPQHEASVANRLHLQALAIAEAGLDDCRVKLGKDVRFPPPPTPDEPYFSYSEAVYDVDDSIVGSFQIKIDQELNQAPFFVYRITSLGVLGDTQRPLAQSRLYQEVDSCPYNRTDPALPNLRRFQVLLREELP
jgi:hypothetical protein